MIFIVNFFFNFSMGDVGGLGFLTSNLSEKIEKIMIRMKVIQFRADYCNPFFFLEGINYWNSVPGPCTLQRIPKS